MRVLFLFLLVALPGVLSSDGLDQARKELAAGHIEPATKLIRDAVAKEPGAAEPNVLLTEALLEAESFDEAGEVVEAALKAAPNSADLHRVQGDVLFREGQVFEAEKEYRAAYKIDNKNARAIFGIARAFEMAALRHKSQSLVRIAHTLDPGDPIINKAFDRLEQATAGPHAVERWQEQWNALEDKSSPPAAHLQREIAVAKALDGKPERALATPYAPYKLALLPLMNGTRFHGYGVNLAINGVKTELQLDTGASGILINSRLAEQAGVKRLADTHAGGIGNEAPHNAWVGYADRIQIGDLVFTNCIVDVVDRGASVMDVKGLIGADVFKRFLVTLNFHAHRIELNPLPGPPWDGETPVDRYVGPELKDFAQVLNIGNHLFIPTRVSEKRDGDETPGLFMIDTGAGMDAISTNMALVVTKVRDSRYHRIRGISGNVKMVYEADKVFLRFANFNKNAPDLTAFDLTNLSRWAHAEVAGIMGMPILSLFASLTLDYRDGFLRFDYKP